MSFHQFWDTFHPENSHSNHHDYLGSGPCIDDITFLIFILLIKEVTNPFKQKEGALNFSAPSFVL